MGFPWNKKKDFLPVDYIPTESTEFFVKEKVSLHVHFVGFSDYQNLMKEKHMTIKDDGKEKVLNLCDVKEIKVFVPLEDEVKYTPSSLKPYSV